MPRRQRQGRTLRMGEWRRCRSELGREAGEDDGLLHPKLRTLVESAVGGGGEPLVLPPLQATRHPARRRASLYAAAEEEKKRKPEYSPSPWARSALAKTDVRRDVSADHDAVSRPWRHNPNNTTAHLGSGKDLQLATDTSRPPPRNAEKNFALLQTYKKWVGPTCCAQKTQLEAPDAQPCHMLCLREALTDCVCS